MHPTPRRPRRWAPRLLASAMAASVLTIGVVPHEAAPAQAADACVPVAVVAFRGSGEKNVDASVASHRGRDHRYGSSDLVTNGWEGPTLQRLLDAYAPITLGSFEADRVPVIGVGPADSTTDHGYPAIAAAWEVLGRLTGSAEDGVASAATQMAQFRSTHSRGCAHSTKFIAIGYSQGAMAARLLAQQHPTDVVGVIDLGDPYQMGSSPGTTGTGRAGNGVVRWNHPWYADRWDAFYDLPLHKSAVCHHGDPICDFRWGTAWSLATSDVPEHLNYMKDTNASEATTLAQELALLARDVTAAASTTTPRPSAPADVVFVIDTTGSMSPYIAQAVATAQAAAQTALRASGSRVGLVEYRDHGDDVVSRVVVPLTSDYAALTGGLQTLLADGGGDWPEAMYSGIVTASRMGLRPTAARSIVVLADAPAHDPEPVTGYTWLSVIARLGGTPPAGGRSGARATAEPGAGEPASAADDVVPGQERTEAADPAATGAAAGRAARLSAVAADGEGEDEGADLPIVLYTLSADPSASEQMAPVVEATGGLSLTLDDADGVAEAIQDALDDTVEAPVARIGVSASATVGITTSVSAVGSTAGDPDITFAFDLDDDGTYETPAPDGVARVTFSTPGPHTVAVRVVDTRGRASVASAVVDVAPVEALVPRSAGIDDRLTVAASPSVVTPGAVLGVTVSGTDLVGATLLLVPGDDPWTAAPVLALEPLPDGWQEDGVTVPGTVPAGAYQLLVVAQDGLYGTATVTVSDTAPPAPGGPVTPVAGPAGPPAPHAAGTVSATAAGRLSATGSDGVARLAALGAALLAVGAAAVLTARRRREG